LQAGGVQSLEPRLQPLAPHLPNRPATIQRFVVRRQRCGTRHDLVPRAMGAAPI
jgi:hypothetical protein